MQSKVAIAPAVSTDTRGVNAAAPDRDVRGRLELLRVSMNAWPSALSGVALMTVVVAAAFLAFLHSASIWLWAGSCLGVYGLHALLLMALRRRWREGLLPPWFAGVNLAIGICSGTLFGMLNWIVPRDPTSVPLMAALACGVQLLGTARTPSTMAMLRAMGLPNAFLTSAGLIWHADLPLAGAIGLLLMLSIVRHGRRVRLDLIEAAEQRQRLDALSVELDRQQALLRAAEKEQAVLNERQRLFRDMHDGLGASLVFALKMIEQRRLTIDEAASVLRGCLDDLRLVIDSLEPFEHDLVTLLATLRYRFGSRLEHAGIEIEWEMTDIPELEWMSASQALDVLRIVQEALTNVVKHAQASRVRLSLSVLNRRQVDGRRIDEIESDESHADANPSYAKDPDAKDPDATNSDTMNSEMICLEIADNGIGFGQKTGIGRGLANMRHRANSLGADLSIEAGEGTVLRLTFPVHARSDHLPNQQRTSDPDAASGEESAVNPNP